MNSLPIDAVLPELLNALRARHEAVLQAPPGAGKTTRVPLALLNEPWLVGQTIVMLEPRRLAARAAAERLASELGEKVGETVGYRIRLDSKVGPRTRIEVVTEGILVRRLQEDPALEGVGLLIFDEFHERSLDADLALALSLNGRALFRTDLNAELPLKILLMSATLESQRLVELLDMAPLVRSEGRMYPVDIRWGRPYQPGEHLEPRVVQTVLEALHDETGSVLVFLPGQAEIRRVQQRLADALIEHADILLCPLHGELALQAQREAIKPAPTGLRKVVLATNIAETSLTIEGVRVVVDAGLARVARFDPNSGMTRLDTQRISRANATQRTGRAGRLAPGVAYRLWSAAQHEQLNAHASAEMLAADLAGLALQLARWGVAPDQLTWLDMPPTAAYAQAQTLLAGLGALRASANGDWQITAHGQAMAGLPAHPRIAHLLLRGHALGLGDLACDVAALLGERDLPRAGANDADMHTRILLLQGVSKSSAVQRCRQSARQYRGYLRGPSAEPVADPEHPRWLGALLALAYPDRLAQQRQPGGAHYRLANGRAAMFAEVDALMKHPWLVIAELGSHQGQREERIYRAAEFDAALFDSVLSDLTSQHDELDWDEREGVLRAERQRKVGELIVAREALPGLDEQARGAALLGLVRRKGLALLPWTPATRQWQARVELLREVDDASAGWPEVSDAALLARLEEWLLPYMGKVSRLSHFAQLDVSAMLTTLLPWPLPQRLEKLAPEQLKVPSGSTVRIDYSEQPPVLAVRLQELFGLAQTPSVADGRQPLKLHLLSPARRPVQVTQDLASFWQNTYPEVKKDLKGRYPKHYWPDDPLIAEPTARVKPRGT